MNAVLTSDVLKMTVPERIRLVVDIWDTIAEVPESVDLSESQKAELDRRLDAYHLHPETGAPWGEVRERIRSRK
ncbi:MAG: addiction module protein [Kiritimatiellia bacterium]